MFKTLVVMMNSAGRVFFHRRQASRVAGSLGPHLRVGWKLALTLFLHDLDFRVNMTYTAVSGRMSQQMIVIIHPMPKATLG